MKRRKTKAGCRSEEMTVEESRVEKSNFLTFNFWTFDSSTKEDLNDGEKN